MVFGPFPYWRMQKGSRLPVQNIEPSLGVFSWFPSFLTQFFKKEENIFVVRRTVLAITDDSLPINDHCPPVENRKTFYFRGRPHSEIGAQKSCHIRKERKGQVQT